MNKEILYANWYNNKNQIVIYSKREQKQIMQQI